MEAPMEILVLESPWTSGLSEGKSVKPFIEGWALIGKAKLRYENFHDMKDLAHFLRLFMAEPDLKICYIAGHGSGGRLKGVDGGINLKSLANATRGRGPGDEGGKGILLGACEVGGNLERLLKSCSPRIAWVAGYDRRIPWVEATLCDLLFLEYMTAGRIKPGGEKSRMFLRAEGKFVSMATASAARAARWVRSDFKLAVRCGFTALERPAPSRRKK
jgi:hypothetical protein